MSIESNDPIISNESGPDISLQEKVAALKNRIEAQKLEVEKSKQQIKEEMVTEIADSIMGHQKIAEEYRLASQDGDWEHIPGYGYDEIEKNERRIIDTEKQSIETKQQKLDLLNTEVVSLESEAGLEAVVELKKELEEEFINIEKRKTALTQKEQEYRSLVDKVRFYKYEQVESTKDIPKFATEQVIKAHKEFNNGDYSAESDEFLKSALAEVKARRTAEWQKQTYEKEEIELGEISNKIQAQERKLGEAEAIINRLSAELENNYQAQEKAIENANRRADIEELKKEYTKKKDDDGFFTKGRSQKRVTEIQSILNQMEKDTFKDVPFDYSYFLNNKILGELRNKYDSVDEYRNKDTDLKFIHFYENEVPKNHPQSGGIQNAHTNIVRRTQEILEKMVKLQSDVENRRQKINAKLDEVFGLPK